MTQCTGNFILSRQRGSFSTLGAPRWKLLPRLCRSKLHSVTTNRFYCSFATALVELPTCHISSGISSTSRQTPEFAWNSNGIKHTPSFLVGSGPVKSSCHVPFDSFPIHGLSAATERGWFVFKFFRFLVSGGAAGVEHIGSWLSFVKRKSTVLRTGITWYVEKFRRILSQFIAPRLLILTMESTRTTICIWSQVFWILTNSFESLGYISHSVKYCLWRSNRIK